MLLPTTSKKRDSTKWVLESGCTCHICHQETSFQHESLDSDGVLIGNDTNTMLLGLSFYKSRLMMTLSGLSLKFVTF